MAASRDIPDNRSASQQRQAVGIPPSSLPSRQSYLRAHSHSVSSGSINSYNRVNRRKSSIQVNQASVIAAATAARDGALAAQLESVGLSSSPRDRPLSVSVSNGSALVDGPSLSAMLGNGKSGSKSRTRRASDSSRVTKERSKSSAAGDLRCDKCGKSYKHGSCLTKHLWEHTPEWQLTSKLLISKHQQVQLLEAASVLVQMNQENAEEILLARDEGHSSASPAASGSSDVIDEDDMSSRTSTPSQDESTNLAGIRGRKRVDSFAGSYARSYQSASAYGASVQSDTIPAHEHWKSTYRALNGQDPSDDEEQTEIKNAAHGLLSGSFGTPRFGVTRLSSGVPPVPPVPSKYMRSDIMSDVDMAEEEDEDEGVFGHMEQ